MNDFRSLFKASLVRFLLYTWKCFYIFLLKLVCLLFINNFCFTIPNKYKNNRFDLHQTARLWPSQWNVVFYEDTYIFSSIHENMMPLSSKFCHYKPGTATIGVHLLRVKNPIQTKSSLNLTLNAKLFKENIIVLKEPLSLFNYLSLNK